MATTASSNTFSFALRRLPLDLEGGGSYYSLPALRDPRIDKLPYTIRVLLESAVRNCDEFQITKEDVEKILGWEKTSMKLVDIPLKPSRVLLQDFTGVPILVDLASMRGAMSELGGDPDKINPMVPADLVIDHSVTANVVRSDNAVQTNMELEFERNKERFTFLKWGSSAFHNMLIIPPGLGIVHQVNLEYLARVVFNRNGLFYPDSVLGTDSHTIMINGLGVLGWGVGGIDAEAAMLGQPMSMVLPGVVGFKLNGTLRNGVTATDLVLTVTQMLRKHGVVGKFVDFYGRGMEELALADRATIANMAPEYGATVGFFPVDHITLQYLKITGREDETGYAVPKDLQDRVVKFDFHGQTAELKHGSVLIAAITSCTNTSNPTVMISSGLVAKKAYELGLEVKPWVKTSLAPGSGVVTKYLRRCSYRKWYHLLACSVNSIPEYHVETYYYKFLCLLEIIAAAVLSGNRNFEGRIHPLTQANYLASPPLVIVYALAGTADINFEEEPIGTGKGDRPVFLRDIWPSSEEVSEIVQSNVLVDMFRSTYEVITKGNPMWNQLVVPTAEVYSWDPSSTYIREPPFFKGMTMDPPGPRSINDAYCLLSFGDCVTTDHISPAGSIHKDSLAAKYLVEHGVKPKDFNSYGSRRGNYEAMMRGTFGNIRIVNKLLGCEPGPKTIHIPTGEKLYVYDAAMRYKTDGQDTIVLAGSEYGTGSSRDWDAKGTMLLGVKSVIAKSFERIHRSNLVGMGVIPLCFKSGEDMESIGLTGHEQYTIHLPSSVHEMRPGQDIVVTTSTGKSFVCTLRFDTEKGSVFLSIPVVEPGH
ncbi:hypothetical protein ACQ4PT_009119 [Festuca glaucescens]